MWYQSIMIDVRGHVDGVARKLVDFKKFPLSLTGLKRKEGLFYSQQSLRSREGTREGIIS